MEPILNDGDRVYIRSGEIKAGDIVMFIQKRKVLLHRVLWLNDLIAFTKGDNVDEGDESLPVKEILGKVYKVAGTDKNIDFKNRRAKYLQNYLLFRSYTLFYMPQPLKFYMGKLLPRRLVVKLLI